MSDLENKPTIFISYCHKDEAWKDRLDPHLRTLQQYGHIVVWDDRKIDAGEKWYPEIEQAMQDAAVAVCLISPDYLASDFIFKEEIPYLLQRREKDGMLLLPVLIRPCPWQAVEWLEEIQMLPRDGKSIAVHYKEIEDEALAEVAELIYNKINDPAFVAPKPTPRWAKPPENCVSIERLPPTPPEVFGRRAELALLDNAWESEKTGIVSFVAWGGVGKSALVNKWVDLMTKDSFRGARRVYAWSFYSQGTGERVTSADLFIDNALRWFGDPATADSSRSPWDKGQRLAELVQQTRTLLLLDGMEPLQSGWQHDRGKITDPALAVLIKQLAKKNPGLCVITTRERLTGLDAYAEWVEQKDLEQISAEAGRALLRAGGVRGTDAQLEQITRDFGNHALAVGLLVRYLGGTPELQAAGASSIPDLDIPVEDGKHPRRVMEAFAERLKGSPELSVLHLIGLFDRPVALGEIKCLRAEPTIRGLTGRIRRLSDRSWKRVIENLRRMRLVASESHHNKGGLDAHPLIREHFGEKLRATHPAAWREAHNRLYEYYKSLPDKELPDTLEEMMPLFEAVGHGCRAGRHQDALDKVFSPRIRRRGLAHSTKELGAFGADLAALAGFFENPWNRPAGNLTEPDKAFVLAAAGFDLRALGRLAEAVEPMGAALAAYAAREDPRRAAILAGNLSELFLTFGDVPQALEYAEQSVKHADDSSDAFEQMCDRTTLADALHQAGRVGEADAAFREAEEMQKESQPKYPLLYSVQGFQYCDLLLDRGGHGEAQRRASEAMEIAKRNRWLLDIGLDHLTLGRAGLAAALGEGAGDFRKAAAELDQAVDGLRKAGQQDELPRGLLARAELGRVRSDFVLARRDLDEAFEIAARGGMRLFECDVHLESCRLILAMAEAGVKLDAQDIAPDSPFALYDAANHPLAAARKHLDNAGTMINEMGYHRRDPEILLETAHLQIIEGNKDAARKTLAAAKEKIDEMGCHRWDRDLGELSDRL